MSINLLFSIESRIDKFALIGIDSRVVFPVLLVEIRAVKLAVLSVESTLPLFSVGADLCIGTRMYFM